MSLGSQVWNDFYPGTGGSSDPPPVTQAASGGIGAGGSGPAMVFVGFVGLLVALRILIELYEDVD